MKQPEAAFLALPLFIAGALLVTARRGVRADAGIVGALVWLMSGLGGPVGAFLACLGLLLTVAEVTTGPGPAGVTSFVVILAMGLGSALAGGALVTLGRRLRAATTAV